VASGAPWRPRHVYGFNGLVNRCSTELLAHPFSTNLSAPHFPRQTHALSDWIWRAYAETMATTTATGLRCRYRAESWR